MIICYLSSSLMGPISGGSTKKRVRKYGAMARVSITFMVAWQAESWRQCLDQLPSHLHEGPFLRRSSQTETILDGEVGNADLSLVKIVSLISLLIGQYISPPQWRPGWDCPQGRPWRREPGEQRISFHFWQSHLFWGTCIQWKVLRHMPTVEIRTRPCGIDIMKNKNYDIHRYRNFLFFSCWHWLCAGWRHLNV